MIGLSGLLFTSASGKNSHWTPRGARFACGDLAFLAGFIGIAGCRESHGVRKDRGGVHAHGSASFEVA